MARRLHLLLLVLFCLLSCRAFAQSPDVKKDDGASAQETKELRRLTMRFVTRYQETRDLAPLTKEFFLEGFESLLGGETFGTPKGFGRDLSGSERNRSYVAFANELYLHSLVRTLSEKSWDLENIFPARLARDLENNPAWGSGVDIDKVTHRQFIRALSRWETAYAKAKILLRKHNYERSSQYREGMKRLMSVVDYQYPVRGSVVDDYDDETPLEFKTRFPIGTRMFHVGTPIGVAIIFVKWKGRYQAIMAGPHPWD